MNRGKSKHSPSVRIKLHTFGAYGNTLIHNVRCVGGENVYHQQWLENVQKVLGKIKKGYANATNTEKIQSKNRIQQIKQSCDDLLHSWAVVEDEMAQLTQTYPELLETEQAIEDEFVMDASTVRQFREGQGYYQLTMFEQATTLFDQLMQAEPDFLLGRLYLGLCYLNQNQFASAKQQFRLVTETTHADDFISFADHMLGCIYVREKADQKASQQFAKVVKIIPDHSDAWFNLATCQYRLQRYQEAIPFFFQALSINGDDWEAMFYLSQCYYQDQQYESHTFWQSQAYEKMKHPRMIRAIAQDYEERNQYEEALAWYHRLHAQDRKNRHAFQGIAWNTWMLDRKEEAYCWLKKGLTLYREDSYLLCLRFWINLQQGEMDQAEKVRQFLPDDVSDDPVWFALQSRFFSQIGDYRKALNIAEQLIQQKTKEVTALGYYQKGKVLLETEQIDEALNYFQQAQNQMQNWNDPIFFEGICHLMKKQHKQTRDCWKKIDLYI